MNKFEQIKCLKRGHILSQDEIEKGQCYKCKAIDEGIFSETDGIEEKSERNSDKVNPDRVYVDEVVDNIMEEYQAKEPLKPSGKNKRTKYAGCLIPTVILLLVLLGLIGTLFFTLIL